MQLNNFGLLLSKPRALGAGLAAQWLLVPMLALLWVTLLPVAPGVALALLVVAAVPGGSISNLATFLAGGHVALSIALTAITTLAAVVISPLILWLMAGQVSERIELPMQQVLLDVLCGMLLTLLAGMLCRRRWANNTAAFARWSLRISVAVLLIIILAALGTGRLHWQSLSLLDALAIIGFMLLLWLVGIYLFRLLGLSNREVVAIDLELALRNVGLGLLLAMLMFPATDIDSNELGVQVITGLLFYGGAALVWTAPMVLMHRWHIHKFGADTVGKTQPVARTRRC